jgi:hypothetical protein
MAKPKHHPFDGETDSLVTSINFLTGYLKVTVSIILIIKS